MSRALGFRPTYFATFWLDLGPGARNSLSWQGRFPSEGVANPPLKAKLAAFSGQGVNAGPATGI